MTALFDQQKAMEQYINEIINEVGHEKKMEGRLEGERTGRLEGKREGRLEGKREGRLEGKMEEKMETAQTLFEMGMSIDNIAKAVKMGTEIVQQWLLGTAAAKP